MSHTQPFSVYKKCRLKAMRIIVYKKRTPKTAKTAAAMLETCNKNQKELLIEGGVANSSADSTPRLRRVVAAFDGGAQLCIWTCWR